MKEEMKVFIITMLYDLERQINEGEYYSYDRDEFEEHVKTAYKLYGFNYHEENVELIVMERSGKGK